MEPKKKEQGCVSYLRNLHLRVTRFGEKSGVGWKHNALRHSFASYWLAEIQNSAKVALEMGNMRDKLLQPCRELVTPEAAKEWFAIVPPQKSTCRRGMNQTPPTSQLIRKRQLARSFSDRPCTNPLARKAADFLRAT